jgi:hypothetical protein
MQEKPMKHMDTPSRRTISGVLTAAALALACAPVAAQTATTTTSTAPTTSTSSATKKPPTSATADMVNEAIQRSQARAAKARQTGTPEQFGSEEPFTYDPAKKNFTPAQQ